MNLLILGAGNNGRVVKEIAVYMGMYDRIAFLDDNSELAVGKLDEYEKYVGEFECAFVAIGNTEIRRSYTEKLKEAGFVIPTLVHPDAYVSSSARVNAGSVVMPKAVIQAKSKVCHGSIISAGAIVDHNSVVGEYCHINCGAIIPSNTEVPPFTKVDYGVVYKK